MIQNKESEFAWMEHLLSTSPYPILRVEKDGTLAYANEASFPLLDIWRIQIGEKLSSTINFFVRKAIRKEEPLEIEVEGKERKYLLSFKPSGYGYVYVHGLDLTSLALKEKRSLEQENQYEFPCESGEFAELTGILPGICIFRDGEETLKIALEVHKVLWKIINNSPAVVFVWKNEMNWPAEFVSENVSLFGYTVQDFTSGRVLYGEIIHREDIDRVRAELDHFVKTGYGDFRTEYRVSTKDGELRWVDGRTFIQRNKAGEATYFQGVVIDITERKIGEKALEKAEKLRKKELNHRIKNNLQIVSSLLDLQAEKFSDSKVIEAFKESKSRILSMSLIHQELYESGKLDALDFSSYIHKLITNLCKSNRVERSKIQVKLDISRVFLRVDTVISLGIIINEMFTNSIKYAFPAGTKGEIHIALYREENREEKDMNAISGGISPAKKIGPEDSLPDLSIFEHFTLAFEDNGEGFPENFDFRNPSTLGFQLVNTLVDQIEGSIELEREKGTKFVIKFKDETQDSS